MTKPRYNTFASWFIILACCFFLYVVLTTIGCHYFNSCPFSYSILNDNQFIGQLAWSSLGFISFVILASLKIKLIEIDSTQKRLLIRNFITRKSQGYYFSELDGFSEMIVNHGRTGRSYKAIGVIKNKTIILKIDSYYYSNMDEMKTALTELPYLGIDINWNNQKFN